MRHILAVDDLFELLISTRSATRRAVSVDSGCDGDVDGC